MDSFSKPSASSHPDKTGFVYHPDMLLHAPGVEFLEKQSSVENPMRLKSIVEKFESIGLMNKLDVVKDFKPCSKQLVSLVHPEEYFDYVNNRWESSAEKLEGKKVIKEKDIYFNEGTSTSARLAVAAMQVAIDKLFAGDWKNCFAAVRPPGHHAGINSKPSGFCFFNNVAAASRYAQKKHGLRKIAIFDWDAHHGNSTQEIFYEDCSVLFISIHRHDQGSFFPGESGALKNLGSKKGEGYNLNMPWNSSRTDNAKHPDDSEYIYVFERMVYPVLKDFSPELLIVSAGFDSAKGDPLGGLSVTQDGYSYMMNRLKTIASGKILAVLEGGYDYQITALAAEATVRTMVGENLPLVCTESKYTTADLLSHLFISEHNMEDINTALHAWANFWPFLLTDQKLVKFEKDTLELGKKRKFIAGVNSKKKLVDYEVCENKFSKKISEESAMKNKEFLSKEGPFKPKLLECSQIPNTKEYWLTMENLLKAGPASSLDSFPCVVASLIMHQTVFDPELLEEQEASLMMGSPLFQLAYSFKEVISPKPLKYLSLPEGSPPKVKTFYDLLLGLFPEGACLSACESLLTSLESLKASFSAPSPNTGYCLLIVGHPNSSFSLNVLSPHNLPPSLQGKEKEAFHSAIQAFSQDLVSSSKTFFPLRKRLTSLKYRPTKCTKGPTKK